MAPNDHLVEACLHLQGAQWHHILLLRIDVDDFELIGPRRPRCRCLLFLDDNTTVSFRNLDGLAMKFAPSEIRNLLAVCIIMVNMLCGCLLTLGIEVPSSVDGIQYESAGPTAPSWWMRHGSRLTVALEFVCCFWVTDSIGCSMIETQFLAFNDFVVLMWDGNDNRMGDAFHVHGCSVSQRVN